jgi:hypothetical protein
MGRLIICLMISLLSGQVLANGAAIILQRELLQDDRSEIIAPAVNNDGFVETANFYRDGPEFFICLPDEDEKKKIVALDEHCVIKKRVKLPWYSLEGYRYDYQPVGKGVDMQSYLDYRFGKGETYFVGVGFRSQRYQTTLIIFYKLAKKD